MGWRLAAPPLSPLPRPPLGSRRDGRAQAEGQVSAPSALPWPYLGLRECLVGTLAAPDLCDSSSSSSPPPLRGGGKARTHLPFRRACTIAHHPPLAPAEGAPCGADSSNAAPPCAPGNTCTRGPMRIAQGLHGAPLPGLLDPARCAGSGKGGAGGGHRRWVSVARRRLCWCVRARAVRPPTEAKEGVGVEVAGGPSPPLDALTLPLSRRHTGRGGGEVAPAIW